MQAVYYSMTTWDGSAPTWIGPERLHHSASATRSSGGCMENNALLLLSIPFAIGIPLGIAAC